MARNKNAYPKSFWKSIYKDYLENNLTYKKLAKKSIKHSNNGVFSIDSYLAVCKKANVKPKVTRDDNGKQT